jgi:hypothetical protein
MNLEEARQLSVMIVRHGGDMRLTRLENILLARAILELADEVERLQTVINDTERYSNDDARARKFLELDNRSGDDPE